jgi:hypothetical protein
LQRNAWLEDTATMEDTHVWVMDASGGNRRDAGRAIDNRQGRVAWSPEGDALYFTVQERGNTRLYRLPAGGGGVAILATRATLASGLYQRGAAACGRECVARPHWQDTVDGIVAAVKSGADLATSLAAWRDLCREIGEEGADAIIACTDLNAVADRAAAGITVVDSAACLAEETVDRHYRCRPAGQLT